MHPNNLTIPFKSVDLKIYGITLSPNDKQIWVMPVNKISAFTGVKVKHIILKNYILICISQESSNVIAEQLANAGVYEQNRSKAQSYLSQCSDFA